MEFHRMASLAFVSIVAVANFYPCIAQHETRWPVVKPPPSWWPLWAIGWLMLTVWCYGTTFAKTGTAHWGKNRKRL